MLIGVDLDKQSITYAAIFGLRSELRLSGDQYSWCVSIFYLGQLLSNWPAAYLLIRLPLRLFIGCTLLPGVVACVCVGLPHSFAGFMAARFRLGLTEGAISPSFVMLTSVFLQKSRASSSRSYMVFHDWLCSNYQSAHHVWHWSRQTFDRSRAGPLFSHCRYNHNLGVAVLLPSPNWYHKGLASDTASARYCNQEARDRSKHSWSGRFQPILSSRGTQITLRLALRVHGTWDYSYDCHHQGDISSVST